MSPGDKRRALVVKLSTDIFKAWQHAEGSGLLDPIVAILDTRNDTIAATIMAESTNPLPLGREDLCLVLVPAEPIAEMLELAQPDIATMLRNLVPEAIPVVVVAYGGALAGYIIPDDEGRPILTGEAHARAWAERVIASRVSPIFSRGGDA
ncbi:MAG: hypothetical protein FJ104_14555 [Deltaproteobacteria bacterium]|nr:hypothetical protein [Deltaproteobacteria bacterium]